jgi:hypothetical protein
VHSVLGQINASIHTLAADFPKISPEALATAAKAKYPGMGRKHDKDSDSTSDCHWLPQWLYTKDSCGTILRTESLMSDFKAMMRLWGHQINGSEMESATFSHSNFKRTGCELAVGALDARSVALLSLVYRMDFEHFGYDADIQPNQRSSLRQRSSRWKRVTDIDRSTSARRSEASESSETSKGSQHSEAWIRREARRIGESDRDGEDETGYRDKAEETRDRDERLEELSRQLDELPLYLGQSSQSESLTSLRASDSVSSDDATSTDTSPSSATAGADRLQSWRNVIFMCESDLVSATD